MVIQIVFIDVKNSVVGFIKKKTIVGGNFDEKDCVDFSVALLFISL